MRAGLAGGLLSGIPSTAYSFATRKDPLDASLAAGSIALPHEERRERLLLAAIPVHVGLSVTWAVVLAAVLPRKNPIIEGTIAGVAIAALDLGLFGRAFPRIHALPSVPQLADHIAFGIVAAVVLTRDREQSQTTAIDKRVTT